MRILHVEDNEDTRMLVAFVLEAEGWETVSADNPKAALTHAASEAFDLYLIDNLTDDATGNSLCADLRSVDQHTPILFYSGAMLDVETVRATGAQGYIEKPCSPDALVAAISKVTRQ